MKRIREIVYSAIWGILWFYLVGTQGAPDWAKIMTFLIMAELSLISYDLRNIKDTL